MIAHAIKILRYAAIGGTATGAFGYMLGAIIGVGMTWHNNNVLTGVPHGSYLFWAHLVGLLIATFTLPVGIFIGLIVGVIRSVEAAQSPHGQE